jgi:DNA repair exonuclease SbcCD ATPase subunit
MLEKKENTAARSRELAEKLNSVLADYSAASITELEDILVLKRKEITEKITETELPDQELNARRNLFRDTKARREELQREEKETIGSFSLNLGTVRGQLRGLPEKIAALEKGMLDRENVLAEKNRELRAAQIARELFDSIAEDSSFIFEKLSCEIGETFSALTEAGRKVSMKNYSAADTSVSDAQNASRNNSLLSAGTRDAFLLAARLVLAQKSLDKGQRALIVLDEPFLTFDKPRIHRALSVLREFHQTTLWQIILFTKDEETANQAVTAFGSSIRVHRLS